LETGIVITWVEAMVAESGLKEEVASVSEPWKNGPYYKQAEAWVHVFWDDSTIFKQEFDKLDLTIVTELACGHGRHFRADRGENRIARPTFDQ
jgi:hypothetical protein